MTAPAATERGELTYRPATPDDLEACAQIWRIALNDYLPSVGGHELPEDVSPLIRMYRHLITTDPDLFWVAERDGTVVAFTAATRRSHVWFLSMLFVLPAEQRGGVGRALLERTMPRPGDGTIIAVAADSAYPPSNGLYAMLGMPTRTPIWPVVGRPKPGWRPPALFAGVTASELPVVDPEAGTITPELQAELDELDRSTLGFARPQDHAWVRRIGCRGWLFRDSQGQLAAYGYVSPAGRIAPVAVREAELLGPVVGYLLTAYEPAGASAMWLPGDADGALAVLLDAGLRYDSHPLLYGWSRPFADFSRCIPINPGLL
jgi:GNAT superfamily N-acetyltransferase